MSDLMIFENKLTEIPVKIDGVDYLLKQMDAGAAGTYKNATVSGVTFSEDGNPMAMKNAGNLEPLAVHLSLWTLKDEKPHQRVPISVVNTWNSDIVSKIAAKALEISGLNVEISTPESIRKEIERLQKKLEKLEEETEERKNG